MTMSICEFPSLLALLFHGIAGMDSRYAQCGLNLSYT